MKQIKIRRQKPVKGGRVSSSSCLIPEIEHKLRNLAIRHNVSKSWVAAVIFARALKINKQDNYE